MPNLWKSSRWRLPKTVHEEHCSNSFGSSEKSVYETSPAQKFLTTGRNAEQFYGSLPGTVSVDFMVRQDIEPKMLWPNGKVRFRNTGKLRQKTPIASEVNDPIVLSSEDEEEGIGSANRMKSKSLHPALCSSPAPSTETVEAAWKGNTSGIEQMVTSITADTESAVILPRKARINNQFGNTIPTAPVKRRKVISQENATDAIIPANFHNSYQSVILNCRCISIGTLRRMVVEPVIFCLDYIRIRLEVSENGTRDIYLKTSELTKCEWCSIRKLPVVFLQTARAACIRLRSQLMMNREDNVWYDCNGAKPAEQYIILIFETSLNPFENSIFEKIIAEIGIKNNISDFFVRIPFEEANSRLVAFTKFFEDTAKESAAQKGKKTSTTLLSTTQTTVLAYNS